MQQTKTIKIFLGSSITELHYERLHLGDYLMNSVRPIFENDGIRIEVIKCEDIRSGNTGKSSQDEIDDKIKESDISVFIFKEKAGKDTIHEFDVARKMQKTKHHEIYVYCFDIPKEARSSELIAFQERLEKQKKNRLYWKPCKDVTDLESQFVLGLLKYERQLLEIKGESALEQETATEKDGDSLFADFIKDEGQRTQRIEKIHQNIDDLLQQTETVMENEDDTIAAKIIKVVELYKKADRWAAATAYDKEKYFVLLFNYAQFLHKYGLYRDAEMVWLRQIPLAEELYGAEHENTAKSYNNLASLYWKQGNYDNALEYDFKALDIQKKKLGLNHPDTARSYNDIGTVYDDQGEYGKALEYYQKALEIDEKVLGKDHPGTATDYNNIGAVYDAQGNYSKALAYYQKALAILEKILGTEHPDTAQSYNNIGLVYKEQGDYDKALEYYQKALAIWEKVLGTEHPLTATSYNNIGVVYKAKGDYDKALEYYQKALAIREKVLGTEHPDTATTYNNIGAVYKEQGDYQKALEYFDKAYSIFEKVLGPKHPNTEVVRGWIALTKAAMGENG